MKIKIEIICNFFFCRKQNADGSEYQYKEVVQKPIDPAYKEIIDKTKNVSLKHLGYVLKEESVEFNAET